ncbi:LppP/LprE family lipoprotein [Streptomyces sp. UNOB3_S3]|uniref:LppP/LprE family lipoprotein n=1 Tax=Streptomyces sp. UNOB3_S3 TaxID=2871682 RepID=UPI001E65D546|nr:LppP/LprE family lipoprotein [Streptomyces sp. UNOB3_S3]MCC3773390.1 LppP/LprE family lipoprotein [Streptomyces sp. UNOB3_S3]
MRSRVGAVAAMCLLLVAASTSCSSGNQVGSPGPTRSVTLWNPSAGRPSPSTAADGPFDVDAAMLRIKRLGYTADDEPSVLKALRGPFRALHGHCTGSVDGHCVSVFFFQGNDYVGYDNPGVTESTIVKQDGTTVTISYPVFTTSDPLCCPSGGKREIRAAFKGGKVAFTPPLPDNPNGPGT